MRLHFAVLALAVLFSGCGDRPEHAACLKACEARNKCAGAKQERCDGLCGAEPKDCTREYADWWTCAGGHLDEACSSDFSSSCGTEFAHWGTCVEAFCLVHALDPDCYY